MPESEPRYTGAPVWVKALIGVVILLVVVAVVLHLAGVGGGHGPGLHGG